jgi:hypothetical protein
MKKTCTQCHLPKDPEKDFGNWAHSKNGKNPCCKVCWSERNKAYRRDNKESIRKAHKAWVTNNPHWELSRIEWRLRTKMEVMTHYSKGSPRCSCCNEWQIVFLAIDHIKGGGCTHRQKIKVSAGHGFYVWLKKQGYPDGYRVLCHNCNHAHHVLGYCPHSPPPD